MQQGFEQKSLASVLDFLNGKSIKPGGSGIYPVYGANGIIGGSDEYRFENAVIIGRVGAYCGSIAYCPSKFWASDNTIVAVPKDSTGDVRFYAYLLEQLELNNYAGGAAQPLVTQTVLKKVDALIPTTQLQKRISAILSAYDDLIENNMRRIHILEEMARRIYEEWFVRFRFPGHENIRMVRSELGVIPDCWKVQRFGDIFKIRYGRTLPTIQLKADGKYPVYGAGGIIGRYDEFNVDKPTALVTSRGAGSGTVWRTRETAFVTNNSLVIEPSNENENWRYFFIELFLKFSPIKTIVGGAAQPQVTIDGLQTVRAIVPQDSVVEKFNQIVEPLSEMIDLLVKKNAALSATRDLLLPKLISGEIDVSNFPEPVAD